MRALRVLVLVMLAGSAGCSTLDWEKVPTILPRESPRMAAARFQMALLAGEKADSYESLTEASRGVIPYVVWKFFMGSQKHPELDILIFDLLIGSKVAACFETGATEFGEQTAEVIGLFEGEINDKNVAESTSIQFYYEDGEWKAGLVETFMPDKVREWHREQAGEKAEEAGGVEP